MRRLITIAAATAVSLLLWATPALAVTTLTPLPDYSAGTVQMRAVFPPGAAEVVFSQDGVHIATVSVEATAVSAYLPKRVLPKRDVKFTAVIKGAGGATLRQVERYVNVTDYVPAPRIGLAHAKVVALISDVPLSSSVPFTRIGITADRTSGVRVETFDTPTKKANVDDLKLRRGQNKIEYTLGNGFGRSSLQTRIVYNLGSVPSVDDFVIVDKPTMYLYYVKNRVVSKRWMIAIGLPITPTPNGDFRLGPPRAAGGAWGVLRRRLYRAPSGTATYYYIHGTNEPPSIGTEASLGCVRMYNWAARQMAAEVPDWTWVRIH